MSSKFVAAMLVTAVLLAAAVFSVSTAQAQAGAKPSGGTVIAKCLYLGNGNGGFTTIVAGVETAGPLDQRLAQALVSDMSCAKAYNILADAGFELVRSRAAPVQSDGVVDAADYVVWRKSGPL